MNVHDLFNYLSAFSMTKGKQLFSQQYQNNHLFDIFSSFIMRACVLVSISTEIKTCF